MGQILVRQLDDAAVARLKARARRQNTSLEALARDAIHKAAELPTEEKLALIAGMRARMSAAMVPGAAQTPAADLIREDRDR